MAEERPGAEPKSILKLDLNTAINQFLKALSRVWARLLSAGVVTLDISRTHVRLMETKGGVVRRWADISYDPREIEPETAKGERALGAVVKISPPSAGVKAPAVKIPPSRRVPLELDLRGKRADEVEPLLDTYLNDAVQSNILQTRIIHGIATGTVRSIVREFLKAHPLVKSFRPGSRDEGGDGVTVVIF